MVVRMAKILIIQNCDQCPNLFGGWKCRLTMKFNKNVPKIPDWCPLADFGEEDEIL